MFDEIWKFKNEYPAEEVLRKAPGLTDVSGLVLDATVPDETEREEYLNPGPDRFWILF